MPAVDRAWLTESPVFMQSLYLNDCCLLAPGPVGIRLPVPADGSLIRLLGPGFSWLLTAMANGIYVALYQEFGGFKASRGPLRDRTIPYPSQPVQ